MLEIFKIGFLTITITDLIDISLVAILFFWFYRALKDTFAVQILFGLLILILLSFFAEAINLKSINWIIKTITSIWLLAFIILFQPELRRLLLMITKSPLFKLFVKAKFSETLDETIDAIKQLSERHIGALIVFTRTQNVEMTVDTGIQLQAVVSTELLMSIFNTKSPLHDGAVIINRQIIVAARCILPLSSITKYQNRNLGTRHRAALGLSEQADPLIVVVSEETGSISIAEAGILTLDIPKSDISAILKSRLSSNS